MKKITSVLLASALLGAALTGCGGNNNTTDSATDKATNAPKTENSGTTTETPKVGVAIYKFDDTFMTGVRNAIDSAAKGIATVDIVDSQNSQPTQNDKVDLFITKKYNGMLINPVDRTAAGVIIEKAKTANIPVVFLNREPLPEDMKKWDKVYYVGAKAEESGTMSGQLIVDYWKAHPEADKNGDGVLQ